MMTSRFELDRFARPTGTEQVPGGSTLTSAARGSGTTAMSSPDKPAAIHFSLGSGARVLDRFTIQRGLGIGGFGEVYFALSDAGKEVALKRVQRNLEIELRGASQCLNLKHPNLISLHDVCRDQQQVWWVVMEYVAGPNLRDALDQQPRGLSVEETRRWFFQAAEGVEYLHQQGLVHRDLKPANLFDDLGVVKVGDYGLTKFISDSRRGGQTESVGTCHYMAPEIGRGQYGREIDLYALGVILYEMLTGRPPFEGETAHEIIIKHLTSQPDLSSVAPPFRQVIEKALRKSPHERWQSAAEMARALRAAETPVIAKLVSPSSRTTPLPVTQYQSPVRSNSDLPPPPAMPAGRVPGGETQALPPSSPVRPQHPASLLPAESPRPLLPSLPAMLAIGVGVILALEFSWVARFPLLALIVVFVGGFAMVRIWRRSSATIPAFADGLDAGDRRGFPGGAPFPHSPDPRASGGTGRHRARHHAAATAPQARMSRQEWLDLRRASLASKPTSALLAELAGSWIAASIMVLICGGLAAAFGLGNGTTQATQVAPYAWVTLSSLLFAGAALTLGKVRERRPHANRTWAALAVGGLVGVAAYGLMAHLLIPLESSQWRTLETLLPPPLYENHATPRAGAMAAHFALLMSVALWCDWTDPLRTRQLRLFSVFGFMLVALLIQQLLPIPQPWGLLVAGISALAIQIAAAREKAVKLPKSYSMRA